MDLVQSGIIQYGGVTESGKVVITGTIGSPLNSLCGQK